MKYLIILAAIITLTGCTQGENGKSGENGAGPRTVINSSVPSGISIKYEFRELFSVGDESGKGHISSSEQFCADGDGNIFVADASGSTIRKFSPDGRFITEFGRTGTGPGEYSRIKSMFVMNGSLFVLDPAAHKGVRFDLNGENSEDIRFTTRVPEFPVPIGNTGSYAATSLDAAPENGRIFLKSSVLRYDSITVTSTQYNEIKFPFDPSDPQLNPMDFMAIYTTDGRNIYLGEISEDAYRVKVFGAEGGHLYDFTRAYRKVRLTEEELEKLSRQVTVDNDEGEIVRNKAVELYNKAIHGIWCDKLGRVWVLPSRQKESDQDKRLVFDIFENGHYIDSETFGFFEGETDFGMNVIMKFIGERLYIADNNGDSFRLRVFEYGEKAQ